MKSLNPVGWGHAGVKKEGANDIIGCANNALGLAILRRGVRTGHAEGDTMCKKEHAGG
jgi:hypothetical protein